MSTKKTILMLFINYILIIVWLALFRLGLLSVLIMLPLTMFAVALDFLLLEGKKQVFFWCMNLLGATVVGIVLSFYLYISYINPDRTGIAFMIIEILTFAAILVIAALVAGRMNARRLKNRKEEPQFRPLVIHRPSDEDEEEDEEEDDEDYDDDEDDDYDDEESLEEQKASEDADRFIEETLDEALSDAMPGPKAVVNKKKKTGGVKPKDKFKMVVKGRKEKV